MATAVAFYRWMLAESILSPHFSLWVERRGHATYEDEKGFRRHVATVRTSLDIPARSPSLSPLEDGVTPVSPEERDAILELAYQHGSYELFLMLSLGFWSGMRFGSIADLKVRTMEDALPVLDCEQLRQIQIGPRANPPVRTKFNINSNGIVVPTRLVVMLLDYAVEARRGTRAALAPPELREHLFLTKRGNSYASAGSDRSPSINAEISRLKRTAHRRGLNIDDFKFHRTRATFATSWARAARESGQLYEFMPILKSMLAHKHDRTTERYIQWIEKEDVQMAVMDEFTRTMFGQFYRAS